MEVDTGPAPKPASQRGMNVQRDPLLPAGYAHLLKKTNTALTCNTHKQPQALPAHR